jgi:hypothetical protein
VRFGEYVDPLGGARLTAVNESQDDDWRLALLPFVSRCSRTDGAEIAPEILVGALLRLGV